jgi:hypothetical protein
VDAEQAPRLAIATGTVAALVGLALAAALGEPYLEADGVNAGLILLGAGLFAALFAIPFSVERGLREAEPDRDRRWERAFIRWGVAAAVVIGAGAVLALAFGLSGHSLGGSIAIVVLVDGVLIAGTLVAWMVSG